MKKEHGCREYNEMTTCKSYSESMPIYAMLQNCIRNAFLFCTLCIEQKWSCWLMDLFLAYFIASPTNCSRFFYNLKCKNIFQTLTCVFRVVLHLRKIQYKFKKNINRGDATMWEPCESWTRTGSFFLKKRALSPIIIYQKPHLFLLTKLEVTNWSDKLPKRQLK